ASCFESTGFSLWDPGIVLALALPQLLPSSHPGLDVLELGCGLSVVGLAAALLGHRCVATDWEAAVEAAHAAGAENLATGLLAEAPGSWRAEVMDWRDPPDWALARRWDVLLGGDLVWSALREGEGSSDVAILQNPLLVLLSRLRYGELLLADRERDYTATAAFFSALRSFGLEARRVEVRPATRAVDIAIWSIRHVCLVTVPEQIWLRDCVTSASDSTFRLPLPALDLVVHACQDLADEELGTVVWDSAVVFATLLVQQPELCAQCRILELGSGTGLVGLVAAAIGAS
ncbi:unnamed protein product, partial [Polarella glacialis]